MVIPIYVPWVVAALSLNCGKADCDLNSSDLIDNKSG